jgi:hypothetical protein
MEANENMHEMRVTRKKIPDNRLEDRVSKGN